MKKYLLTGLIILLPVALTIAIAFFIFDFFTEPFVPLFCTVLDCFPPSVPAEVLLFLSRLVALILLCSVITILGMLTQQLFFKHLGEVGNWLIVRIPFVKTIYRVSNEIIQAIFSADGKQAFRNTVLVPFPDRPHYAVGFEAGEVAKECQEKIGRPVVSVFVPTAPHPISGFLFLVAQEDVSTVQMSKEDALKYLVSCGVIHPESEKHDEHL